jgi:hypothetical protein
MVILTIAPETLVKDIKKIIFILKTTLFYFSNIDYTHFNIILLFKISLTSAPGTLVIIFLESIYNEFHHSFSLKRYIL